MLASSLPLDAAAFAEDPTEELLRRYFTECLVDGDRAAVRCRVTGTHPGTAPAGDDEAAEDRGRLEIDEAFFYRLKDGKIDSGKPFSDRWAVAQALGYTVTPPQPGG